MSNYTFNNRGNTMITSAENDLMCRVEGDAPMGSVMRHYWMVACLSEEIKESGGKPLRVGLIGKKYVAFRNTAGEAGFLDEKCSHRGASLALGRNEECGLTCLYHGWRTNVKGEIIDMPSEPEESGFRKKIKHNAYAVKEWAGVIWVYLGDQTEVPEFVPPAWAPTADTKVSIAKIRIPCNWAQVTEGALDSAHSSSLHSSDMVPSRVLEAEADESSWYRPSTDKNPKFRVEKTNYGYHYAAIRRPIKNASTHDYIRTSVFVAPMSVLIPPNKSYNVANVNVPIDDDNTMFHFIGWGENCPDQDAWCKFLSAEQGIDVDEKWISKRNIDNDFLQDRELMAEGNYTGIPGIPNQDIAMWITMGSVADRTEDTLGASDISIVEFRRCVLEQVNLMKSDPKEFSQQIYRKGVETILPSWQGVVPKGTDWTSLEGRSKVKMT
ncbi:MAG: phthalate 4,5-dioxygenase oxygenase subunit [Colwellia polaris]|jgi:phthalate 4,5-dioxygenase oxygenase subunit